MIYACEDREEHSPLNRYAIPPSHSFHKALISWRGICKLAGFANILYHRFPTLAFDRKESLKINKLYT